MTQDTTLKPCPKTDLILSLSRDGGMNGFFLRIASTSEDGRVRAWELTEGLREYLAPGVRITAEVEPSRFAARPAAPEIERLTRERDEARDMFHVQCRAIGNWREWGDKPSTDHEHPDWQVATKAIMERDELRAEAARLRSALEKIARTDTHTVDVVPVGGAQGGQFSYDGPCAKIAREALSASPNPVADVVEAARKAVNGLREWYGQDALRDGELSDVPEIIALIDALSRLDGGAQQEGK